MILNEPTISTVISSAFQIILGSHFGVRTQWKTAFEIYFCGMYVIKNIHLDLS